MAKTMAITATVSTDMRFTDRYFLDLRDTTDGRNVQKGARHLADAEDVANFLRAAKKAAEKANVEVTFIDDTAGELSHLV